MQICWKWKQIMYHSLSGGWRLTAFNRGEKGEREAERHWEISRNETQLHPITHLNLFLVSNSSRPWKELALNHETFESVGFTVV